ncbi:MULTISPECIES: SsrA-binding protein SmpB [Holzapfeliella]
MKKQQNTDNLIAQNRKANHNYFIDETVEAGLVLTGTEIKSIRNRRVNIKDGYVRIRRGEAWLENVHISEYKEGNQFNQEPTRNRKLLLHKKQIAHLLGIQQEKGLTIVPLKVYLKRGFAKVLIGVGRGKKNYDKRETIRRRDQERDMQRLLKVR